MNIQSRTYYCRVWNELNIRRFSYRTRNCYVTRDEKAKVVIMQVREEIDIGNWINITLLNFID
jgi:hypothetical protein